MSLRRPWRTLSEVKVEDISVWVKEAIKGGQHVHIGTDSLQTSRTTSFCTVVVILTPGKGGRAAYSRRTTPRIKSLRDRLAQETWDSLEIAMELAPIVKNDLTIHLDVNVDEKYRSTQYRQELVGAVVGQGFKYLVKPDSWASSHIADWAVRHNGREELRLVG